ncbi:MAG: NAD-dependent deacylase [Deltaproteobacteria bacterium]|jgi:NAD-dependent deacetylase|nr:NAD-dependent deacylase [Deltaproteobacteria bacterium]
MIFILTGSGISRESGILTFRDEGGWWNKYKFEDVSSIEGFRRDPQKVQEFYNLRRRELQSEKIQPNLAHLALAKLQKQREVYLVTQNVDDLHERAGSSRVVHMHGELLKTRCQFCYHLMVWKDDLVNEKCPRCQKESALRPHVVLFGETPLFLGEIYARLVEARFFVAIGTSGTVFPAADFVNRAKNAYKIDINLYPSAISSGFDEVILGPATQVVPSWVERMLKEI